MTREKLIEKYFNDGYSYMEILNFLKKDGFSISYRHLQRTLKNLDLKRKNISEDIPAIISAIMDELESSGSCLGYKAMWARLKHLYKLTVYRDTVRHLLSILDPEGVEKRSRYRLHRREYSVPGPNFIWHIDGYDKLKPFGFAIHSCIDGYSRKVLWLKMSTTNNDPLVISYYYLKTVEKRKLIPVLIRSDHGTENSVVECVHQAFRSDNNDVLAGVNSFIKGKSTANQRVESSWGRMRRHSVDFWINFFKDMVDCKDFDRHDKMQLECLRFCFGALIQYDLEITKKEWNSHAIRKQKGSAIVSGKPNYLYYAASENGAKDCGLEINETKISNALHNFSKKPSYCSINFLQMMSELYPDIETPTNVKEATILYHKIMNDINNCT